MCVQINRAVILRSPWLEWEEKSGSREFNHLSSHRHSFFLESSSPIFSNIGDERGSGWSKVQRSLLPAERWDISHIAIAHSRTFAGSPPPLGRAPAQPVPIGFLFEDLRGGSVYATIAQLIIVLAKKILAEGSGLTILVPLSIVLYQLLFGYLFCLIVYCQP